MGSRSHVSISKVPAVTKVKHAIGTAIEQNDKYKKEIRPGGELQILFEQFNDSWILDTRKSP